MTSTQLRTYSELSKLSTFKDRLDYLLLGDRTQNGVYGTERLIKQSLYVAPEWKEVRNYIIIRDNGFDLGLPDRPIFGQAMVHHMNPITMDMVLSRDPRVFDPEYLILVSRITHEAIHLGNPNMLPKDYKPRTPYDTCPWRQPNQNGR